MDCKLNKGINFKTMKGLNFWKRVSNSSAIIGLVLFIIFSFLRDYIKNITLQLLYIAFVTIIVFLSSELIKLWIKRNNNEKK